MYERASVCSSGTKISYLRSPGRQNRPRVLFVHGSPNAAIYWERFLNDPPADLEAVAVDRPGFGESGPGRSVPALDQQARLISPLLVTRKGIGTILVGQSQGGPIVCQMAADYPDAVAGLVVTAGALEPASNHPAWWQRLANARPFYRLLPERWATAVDEVMALEQQLEALAGRLPEIRCPVRILQGSRDWLVGPRNGAYLRDHLTGAPRVDLTRIDGAKHKIPQTHDALVRSAIEDLARRLPSG